MTPRSRISIRFLQELLRFESGVKRMSAGKVHVAGGAALDHAGTKQLSQLH